MHSKDILKIVLISEYCVFLPHAQSSWDRLWIHSDPNQDKVLDEGDDDDDDERATVFDSRVKIKSF